MFTQRLTIKDRLLLTAAPFRKSSCFTQQTGGLLSRLVGIFILLHTLFYSLPGYSQINTDRTMSMGRNALFFEDYMLSIQYFNRVIEAKPYMALPYFFRGLAKLRLGDYHGTVSDGSEAIQRNPFLTDSYQIRAIGYIELKQYEEAVRDYEYILSVNPTETNALHNLALCYMNLKEYDKAQVTLDQLHRYSSSGKERIWLMKASSSLEQSDTLQAMAYVDQSLALDSTQQSAYVFKAYLYSKQENWELAEEELTKAFRYGEPDADLYLNRAMARYYQWKLDGALADYDQAIEIRPQHFIARYNRGLLRMNVGDDNRAIEDFNFILEKEPDNDQALVNRGILLIQTGDYQGAIRDFTRILDAHPNFLEGYQYRAEAYRKAGMSVQAAQDETILMRADLDMRFGGNSWRSPGEPKPARKLSDEEVENYSQMVEAEDSGEPEIAYKNPMRGRIQNRTADAKPEPAFYLSFYRKHDDMKQVFTFYKPLEELNRRQIFAENALLTNQEKNLSEGQISQRFESIRQLTERLEKEPKQASLYLSRALEYSLTQDLENALADLQKALELDSTLMWNYFLQANVRWKMFLLSEHESQEAQTAPKPAPDKDAQKESLPAPTPATVRQLELQAILHDLDKTLELAPDFAFAYYNKGLVLSRLSRNTEAITNYGKAIEYEPTLAEAYFNRGLLRVENNQTQEGLNDLSSAGELGIGSAYNLIKRYSK